MFKFDVATSAMLHGRWTDDRIAATPPQSSRLRLAQSCTHGQDPGQGQALLIRPPLGTYSYIVVIMQIFAIL